jgi:hypothetical protein
MNGYEPAESCGCDTYTSGGDIVFCPLHNAAPDLLVALKALRADEWRCTVDWGPRDERDAINDAADAAIAKAEGR